jgi:hypothetical protein
MSPNRNRTGVRARVVPSTSTPTGPSIPLSETKAALFKALGHPARIRCLEVLAGGERSVGDLQPCWSPGYRSPRWPVC